MAKLTTLFDATKVKPNQRPSPVPAGKYPVKIISSEMVPTKDAGKKASFLLLTFEIIDGEFKGRQLWDRLNLVNPNAKAVEIAQGTLSAICHSVQVMQVPDTLVLHNKPLMAEVTLEAAQYDPKNPTKLLYAEKNEIRGYEPMDGALPATGGATTAAGGPGWLGKGTTATEAPAAEPAATKVKGPPGRKAPPAAAAAAEPVTDERQFYVQMPDETTPLHSGTDIIAMLAAGMPAETPICLDGDEAWGTAASYKVGEQAHAPTAAPAKDNISPWKAAAAKK